LHEKLSFSFYKKYVVNSLISRHIVHLASERNWAMIYSQLMIFFEDRLGKQVNEHVSVPLIEAIISQRMYKTDIEIQEIEKALGKPIPKTIDEIEAVCGSDV